MTFLASQRLAQAPIIGEIETMKKRNVVKNCVPGFLLLAVSTGVMAENGSRVGELEARIVQLEQLLQQQMQTQKSQSDKIESFTVKVSEVSRLALKSDSEAKDGYGVSIYGSLRPRLTYREEADESSTDVTDALSRIGLKGSMAISESLTAFYRGEWDVDMESNGNFGDARLAYVGVEGDYGRVAIGQQWSPHYNIVAEVTDLFNHRSSPFAYDNVGPFRTSNLVTYSFSHGGFRFDSSIQANGDLDISGNSGDESQTNDYSHIDSGSFGVGYQFGEIYLGASYLEQQLEGGQGNDSERGMMGVAGSWNVTDDLYLAFTYQDVTVEQTGSEDLDQSTLDLVGAFSLGDGYKIKAAYFSFDDDVDGSGSDAQDGFNLTLEKQMGDLRLFMEWLSRNFEERAERKTLSLGLRYDFELAL